MSKLWIMYIFTVSMYMKNSESIFEETVDEVQRGFILDGWKSKECNYAAFPISIKFITNHLK